MPEIQAGVSLPWGAAALAQAGVSLPWDVAGFVQTRGSGYTAPPAPPGGTEVSPGSLVAGTALNALAAYSQVHTLQVLDLRDGVELDVESVSIGYQDGSLVWTLSADAMRGAWGKLRAGEQPAAVEVRIDGLVWRFIVDSLDRAAAFANERITIQGSSLCRAAGGPYQIAQQWTTETPTTAAQIATLAQLYTEVDIRWEMDDWTVPAGAWSFAGTPLQVVQAVAEAVGATVLPHRSDPALTVRARYPVMPNEWAYTAPDVQVHWHAAESESIRRADRPLYTGIVVAGQQQGALGYVTLIGTNGADQAPMVTHPLLTDIAAVRMRGEAELGASGPQELVTRVLPVRVGAGEPGVLEPGQLVRWIDDGAIWHGVVRAVSVQASLGQASQTVVCERHTGFAVEGEAIVSMEWAPVPEQQMFTGVVSALNFAPFIVGGVPPFALSLRAGSIPGGTAFVGSTIAGTPTLSGAYSGVRLRATDSVGNMADSDPFSIVVADQDPLWGQVLLLVRGDGDPGAHVITDSSSYARVAGINGLIETAADANSWGGSAVRTFSGSTPNYALFTQPGGFFAADDADYTIEGWIQFIDRVGSVGYADGRHSVLRLTQAGVKVLEVSASALSAANVIVAYPTAYSVNVGDWANRFFFVVQRKDGTARVSVNGGPWSASAEPAAWNPDAIIVGNAAVSATRTAGAFIDELRLTAGARYSPFGPESSGPPMPTGPFAAG